MNLPFLLMGSGAVSCLFAARFSAVEIPFVMLVNWPEGYSALKNQGVTLINDSGEPTQYLVHVVNAAELVEPVSDALILVKAWQTERSAHQVAQVLEQNGLALSLQNGAGNHEILAKSLGQKRASVGINEYGATSVAPGIVKTAGSGRIVIENTSRVERLHKALVLAGFNVETSDDIYGLVWQKLLINAVINPLATFFEIPNGKLLESPHTIKIMEMLCSEILDLYQHLSIHIPAQDPLSEVYKVINSTRTNRCSMLQDLDRGTKPEIEQITGVLIQKADARNYKMPFNALVYEMLMAKFEKKLTIKQ